MISWIVDGLAVGPIVRWPVFDCAASYNNAVHIRSYLGRVLLSGEGQRKGHGSPRVAACSPKPPLLFDDRLEPPLECFLPDLEDGEGYQNARAKHYEEEEYDLLPCVHLREIDGVEAGQAHRTHGQEQGVGIADAAGGRGGAPEYDRGKHTGANEVGIVKGDEVGWGQVYRNCTASARKGWRETDPEW